MGQDAGCRWLESKGIDPAEVPMRGRVRRVGWHAEVEVRVRDDDGKLLVAGNSIVTSWTPVRLTSLDRVWLRRGRGRHRQAGPQETGAALHAARVA
jgi:hypothetical protein